MRRGKASTVGVSASSNPRVAERRYRAEHRQSDRLPKPRDLPADQAFIAHSQIQQVSEYAVAVALHYLRRYRKRDTLALGDMHLKLMHPPNDAGERGHLAHRATVRSLPVQDKSDGQPFAPALIPRRSFERKIHR